MTTCPKCGYARQPQDDSLCPADSCPRCGVIYAKCKPVKTADAGSTPSDSCSPSDPEQKSPDTETNVRETIFNSFRDYLSPPKIVAFLARQLGGKIKAYLLLFGILSLLMFLFGQSPVASLLWSTNDEITYAVQNGACKDRRILFYTLIIGNTGKNPIPDTLVRLTNVQFSLQQVYYRVRNLDASSPRAFDPEIKIQCSDSTWRPCPNYKQPVMGFGAGPCVGLPILVHDCIEDMREDSFADPCVLDDIGERENTGRPLPARIPENSEDGFQLDRRVMPEPPECTTIADIDNQEFERVFRIENLAAGAYLELGFVNYEVSSKKVSKDDFELISVYMDTNATVRRGDPRLTAVGKIFKKIINLFT